ncbi:hypothetical protein WB66_08875 [bacteria symbiont BFo1 of Frankliniella occidentalis]|jgi:YD repeat-containing protein|uniref:YD repeat-containing protein n=1 Tax=Erwinia aphidicola TaxID=68334 RepID=A0ABU8DP09_ERWAP|nr:hypothetical protein [uncultured Erwinia sp.]KMV70987.1 hypothetical protein AI28_05160 [bacteria symbiont BFo1 of Frankliniella occidentalis]KYP85212.1 hypothetical protein WB66_08875 [bacteria symbiont BFo1 of Frankliniella occidentalis]KYP90420.1 hypothetical protein WB91_09035 [bacteria symbiont BFo1 of Frankliniella occidentalis]PIJ58781.1 hypothetical protein BOM23_08045 [Erwinia sp. OLMDLW33]
MKIFACTLTALMTLLVAPAGYAAAACAPGSQQVNNNNSLMMLGGTAKGPVKQFVVGEFGKDVDQQKRMLGQFDRCGALLRADISYEKQEGNMQIKLVQNIERVGQGWRSGYDLVVFQLKDGQPVEVNHKQGTIDYHTGKRGSITSSTDKFLLQGEEGFTETTNRFDDKQRLVRSVSRGSDQNSNGAFDYRWNNNNQLLSSKSERSTMQWRYDKQERELSLTTKTDNPLSSMTSVDECQLWDDRGNCTLSYSREMEVFPSGIVRRNITAAYRFEYWE